MAHWPSPTSGSLASRSSSDSFAGSGRLSGGMAPAGGTPTPDLPPLGIWSGLRLIRCPECGGEEYNIPEPGGTTTGNPSNCRQNEAGVPGGGCCCFKTHEEYEKIIVPALSGEPVGNPEMVAAVEDLKHEIVAQTLAVAQLKTDIEDVKGFKGKLGAGDKVQKVAKA